MRRVISLSLLHHLQLSQVALARRAQIGGVLVAVDLGASAFDSRNRGVRRQVEKDSVVGNPHTLHAGQPRQDRKHIGRMKVRQALAGLGPQSRPVEKMLERVVDVISGRWVVDWAAVVEGTTRT